MIPALLAALQLAPTVLSAGRDIVGAFTGRELAPDATPEDIAAEIEALPEDQRMAATMQVMQAKTRAQELDTDRFYALTSGSAEHVRSTARPEIALRAMAVVTLFARGAAFLFVLVMLDWAVRSYCVLTGQPTPVLPSVTALLAQLEPVAEVVWAPLLGSFWAAVEIVKKYMGCRRARQGARRRDAGRPAARVGEGDGGGCGRRRRRHHPRAQRALAVDPEAATWLVRIAAGVIISGLGVAVRGMFVRVRTAEAKVAVLESRPPSSDAAGKTALGEVQALKLCLAQHYVRRDDYVMQMTGVIQKLDSIGTMVSRLDEWRRIQEDFKTS